MGAGNATNFRAEVRRYGSPSSCVCFLQPFDEPTPERRIHLSDRYARIVRECGASTLCDGEPVSRQLGYRVMLLVAMDETSVFQQAESNVYAAARDYTRADEIEAEGVTAIELDEDRVVALGQLRHVGTIHRHHFWQRGYWRLLSHVSGNSLLV